MVFIGLTILSGFATLNDNIATFTSAVVQCLKCGIEFLVMSDQCLGQIIFKVMPILFQSWSTTLMQRRCNVEMLSEYRFSGN